MPGSWRCPNLSRTEEGREMQFATNYLGHFALTLALHPALKVGRRRTGRVGQLQRTPVFAGGLRRPRLPVPALRPVDGVRPIQNGRRPPGGGGDSTAGRMTESSPTRSTRARSPQDSRSTPVACALLRSSEDYRAGGCDLCAAGSVTAGRRDRRALLRRLQRITPRDGAPERFSGGVAAYALDPDNAARLWDIGVAFAGLTE